MTNLDEIYVFARVAMLKSFSQASKSLDMPVSTVSRKISNLEKRMNVVLIQRTTRKLRLTDQGVRFYEQCVFHLQGIEDAKVGILESNKSLEGLLKISVPVAMGRGSFIDFISAFLIRYPKIQIDLIVTNQYMDLISENIDLAIRFGHLKDSGVIARRLGFSRRLVVASPQYLKVHGTPKTPRELQTHNCLHFQPNEGGARWELVSAKGKTQVKISGSILGSDFNTVNEFALRGHGVALLPESYCHQAFKSGGLAHILTNWSSLPTPVSAVYVNRKYLPQRLQLLLDDLIKWKNPNWR